MTAAALAPRSTSKISSAGVLNGAVRFWFIAMVASQGAFLTYILGFYGRSIAAGQFSAWKRNDMLYKGYVAGDATGNWVFAIHVMLAAAVTFGGVLQLVPQIRSRIPAIHRCNGRIFLATAMVAAMAGLWMVWARHAVGGLDGAVSITLDALLILAFGALAWRSAITRDLVAHRRWALRAFLAANGVFFFRAGIFAWAIANNGHTGGFEQAWNFGCYLLPLTVLELYLRAARGPAGRWVVAGLIVPLTLVMTLGIAGMGMALWLPLLKA